MMPMTPPPTGRRSNGCGPLWFWIALFVIGALLVLIWTGNLAGASDTTSAPPTARNTRVPCHAPPAVATCTPTPTSEPTVTPTNSPTSFPPGSPTVTAVPTDTPTSTHTAAPTLTGTVGPTGTPTPCPHNTYWACVTPAEFAAETGRLINVHRQTVHGYGLLTMRADLSRAEELWAIEMIGDPFVNEDDRCEHGDYGTRAAQQGYTGFAWGNIGACGYDTPAATVQGWIDSPGHHFIMDAWDMTEFGVGAAQYGNGYWQAWSTVGCGHDIPCLQP